MEPGAALDTRILWPVLGHLVLIQVLFFMVSYKRWQASKAGKLDYSDLAWTGKEPELSRRWAKNLDNQFQIPMLFYALVALLFATGQITTVQVWLAWLFLAGRIIHSIVQISSDNVELRGRVFVINYGAVSVMWLLFLFNTLVQS